MLRLALLSLLAGCEILFELEDPPNVPLRAHYTMDTIDGNTTEDSSGFDHVAACTSACPVVFPGFHDGGLRFDGATTVMRVSSAPDLESSRFTLAVWVRVQTLLEPKGCIASKRFGPLGSNSWLFCINEGGSLFVQTDHAGIAETATDERSIGDGNFHHLAMTWDGADRIVYLDGFPGAPQSNPLALDVDEGPITIGAEDDGGALKLFFAGVIDDLRIYNVALTEAEILELAAR